MSHENCLVEQFQRHAELDEHEIELLTAIEDDEQEFPAGTILCNAGKEAGALFCLHSGWACAARLLPDGRRQLLDIFLPGQIMGLGGVAYKRSQTELTALTTIRACPLPEAYLNELFAASPRLARILFQMLAHEHALLTERIINIGRRSAAHRLAHFLLEMKIRLRVPGMEFDWPLNQESIADALGISSVHVSRTFSQLRAKSLVRVDNNRVVIDDLVGLMDLAGFDPAYL